MTFDDIPKGASVFLDANVLLNAFSSHPTFGAACDKLLDCALLGPLLYPAVNFSYHSTARMPMRCPLPAPVCLTRARR